MMLKVGIGYDIHRLAPRRRLFIGGVRIPSPRGLLGHSDADVVIHAICDALLGAMGAGDIGHHFPDTDRAYKNASSLELLKKVGRLLEKNSYVVGNIDVMLLLESPKISRYRNKMKTRMAKVLKIDRDQISIKATTHEGVGAIGRGEAAAAYAVVLIQSRRSP